MKKNSEPDGMTVDDFEDISGELSPLRKLRPPPETRKANAAIVSKELARLNQSVSQPRRPAAWRRDIAVPLPVAGLMLVALVVLSALQIRGGDAAKPVQDIAASRSVSPSPEKKMVSEQPSTQPSASTPDSKARRCEPTFYQEQTVVAGLGAINTIRYYECKREGE